MIFVVYSGGFKVGGARGKTKKGPLMTSSYLANRDKHFSSNLRYGHRRIGLRSWDYGMTDIAGDNAKGCSWYKILITLKIGKITLATHKNRPVTSLGEEFSELCPILLNDVLHIFPGGDEQFCRGGLRPPWLRACIKVRQ